MIDSFYIAWRYLKFNAIRSVILIACVSLITFVPAALQLLLNNSEQQLISRAASTPLILGAKGSELDLTMNSLYFDNGSVEFISMLDVQEIEAEQLALVIPLYKRFKARSYPVIGTTIDYFDYRNLHLESGRWMGVLGETVIGSKVARTLNLKVGDTIVTSPENLFDLAGVYPLKMHIVGILAPSFSADDLALFSDLKTTWVIQGLGHGHQDLAEIKDQTVILKRSDDNLVANAKLMQFSEITAENIDGFHFHGDLSAYPLTAAITLPYDHKSEAILRGRYQENALLSLVRPKQVIEGLLDSIFKIKQLMDSVIGLITGTTLLALLLVFLLSLRLRERELKTIYKLGCSQLTILKLLVSEILLIVFFSLLVCTSLLFFVELYSDDLVRMLLLD